jgi:hypothetical protein
MERDLDPEELEQEEDAFGQSQLIIAHVNDNCARNKLIIRLIVAGLFDTDINPDMDCELAVDQPTLPDECDVSCRGRELTSRTGTLHYRVTTFSVMCTRSS